MSLAGVEVMWFLSSVLNVKVKKFKQAQVIKFNKKLQIYKSNCDVPRGCWSNVISAQCSEYQREEIKASAHKNI